MLSNPTAFADVVLPHAKPANKQFLGKKPADLRQIRDFSRPQVSGRQSRLPPEAIIGGTQTIIGIESPPADWLGAQLPLLDRQAPFNFQLASTKPASSPSPNWTVQYNTLPSGETRAVVAPAVSRSRIRNSYIGTRQNSGLANGCAAAPSQFSHIGAARELRCKVPGFCHDQSGPVLIWWELFSAGVSSMPIDNE